MKDTSKDNKPVDGMRSNFRSKQNKGRVVSRRRSSFIFVHLRHDSVADAQS